MNRRLRVGVVGGGIGGLTTALALGERHDVTVIERAPELQAVGAGLVLAANATRVLGSLGVELDGLGRHLTTSDLRLADGTLLQRLELSRTASSLGPTIAVSRPALHTTLAASLPAAVELRFGRGVTSVVAGAQPVVRFDDGSADEFDLVIGADGIHSAVRTALGSPVGLRYSGVTCWRGIVDDWGVDAASEWWGDQVRVGLVPLDGAVYYFLVASAPAGSPPPASADEVATLFRGFTGDAERLLALVEWPPPLHHDLWELDRPEWGDDSVILLGDAAHAMTPNLGQGAAMAIEDAMALALALRDGTVGLADRYRRTRQRRVRGVQLTSRRLGRLAHIAGPTGRRVRNAVVRSLPQAVADRQHRRLVAPGVALAEAHSAGDAPSTAR